MKMFILLLKKNQPPSTANIAEGYGRFHYQEGIQFYRIARGSLYELKDHLITCNDLGYIKKKLFEEGLLLIEESKKILNGYINFVKNKTKRAEFSVVENSEISYSLVSLYLIYD